MFIRAFIAYYVILKLWKLVAYDDDKVQYNETLSDLNTTGQISYANTSFNMFMILKNINRQERKKGKKKNDDQFHPIFIEEGVERYIQLLFVQSSEDWY